MAVVFRGQKGGGGERAEFDHFAPGEFADGQIVDACKGNLLPASAKPRAVGAQDDGRDFRGCQFGIGIGKPLFGQDHSVDSVTFPAPDRLGRQFRRTLDDMHVPVSELVDGIEDARKDVPARSAREVERDDDIVRL